MAAAALATAFGPQGPNFSTSRPPTSTQASSGVDTWARDCSGPGKKDGVFLDASFFNNIIGNMRFAARQAGVSLVDGDDTMIMQAMMVGMFLGTVSGVNNLVASLPANASLPALIPDMRFSGLIQSPNTGAVTLTIAGLGGTPQTYNVVKGGTRSLAQGDLVTGLLTEFLWDGTNFQLRGSASAATIITSNTTVTVGPAGQYTSLRAAMSAISTWIIASTAYVIIQVQAGYIEVVNGTTGPLYLSHPYGQRIQIVGAGLIGNVAFPTAGNYDGKSNSYILSNLQSIFAFTIQATGSNAVEVHAGIIGFIQNCLIYSTDGSGYKGFLGGNWSKEMGTGGASFSNCWVHGFGGDGFKGEYNFFSQVNNFGATYNGGNGIFMSHHSTLDLYQGSMVSMYNQNGLATFNTGGIYADGGIVDSRRNNATGCIATNKGSISMYGAAAVRIQNNGSFGCQAYGGGAAVAVPAVTQFGGNGSYDMYASGGANCYTAGASLPSGSSPALGNVGNNNSQVIVA